MYRTHRNNDAIGDGALGGQVPVPFVLGLVDIVHKTASSRILIATPNAICVGNLYTFSGYLVGKTQEKRQSKA